MNPIESYLQKLTSFYTTLENFITEDEPNQNFKIKKKIALYYCYLMICYSILLPIFNPYIPFSTCIAALTVIAGHLLLLKGKNYFLTEFIFVSFPLFGLYLNAKSPENFLRVIGVALCQHNQALLVTNNKILKLLFIFGSLLIVTKIQRQFDGIIEDNNLVLMVDAIKSLQYSWPIFYFCNHFSGTNLANEYCNAFETSQKAQEELKKKNQELFEVNEKLKSTLSLLEHANNELKEAIKVRELFIASVSHELRNPLNSMLGNIELLGLEVRDPRWLKMLDTCKICGETLLGLINNVLDVAKINAEKLELNCQPSNFYRVIEKVWIMTTIKMREKGLNGYLHIARDVPKYLKIDSHRLNQILLNLIGNATKFTKTGYVKVIITWHQKEDDPKMNSYSLESIELINKKINSDVSPLYSSINSKSKIDLFTKSNCYEDETQLDFEFDSYRSTLKRIIPMKSLSDIKTLTNVVFNENDSKIHDKLQANNYAEYYKQNKGFLKIEIVDSGCGISEKAIQRLFQAFSQADSSITRRFGGTGLGLYITKQLIQKMGGQINVYSRENVGSDFWMILPCQTAGKDDVEKNSCEEGFKPQTCRTRAWRVLVVDDDPLNQMIMTNYFNKMNIQADIANNGQEALYKFKTQEIGYYCLITMDLQMPIMDGLTACKEIRKYEKSIRAKETISIAIVTGNCMDIEKNRWLDPMGEIRASYIFRKPFTFEECKLCVGGMFPQHNSKFQKLCP